MKLDPEVFEQLQDRVQQALDGAALEDAITVLAATLTTALCCSATNKRKTRRMLRDIFAAMDANISEHHDSYASQYEQLARRSTH